MKTKDVTTVSTLTKSIEHSYLGQPYELMRKNEHALFPQELIDEVVHLHATLRELSHTQTDSLVQNMRYYLAVQEWKCAYLEEHLPVYGMLPPSAWTQSVGQSITGILQRVSEHTEQWYGEQLPAPSRKELEEVASRRKQFFQGTQTVPSLMLTMPSTASSDEQFIEQSVQAGVRFFRINTAHDTLEDRKKMAELIKKAAKKYTKEVFVSVDLASWKMRTGKAERELKPVVLAEKKQTTSVILTSKKKAFTCVATSSHAINHMATIAVSDIFLQMCDEGTTIELTDAKGKVRELVVSKKEEKLVICTLSGKTIIDAHSTLVVKNNDQVLEAHPQHIRPQPVEIVVQEGDEVYIGEDVKHSSRAHGDKPVKLSITDPIALEGVKKGDHIFIDDGKVGLVVTKNHKNGVTTRVMYGKNKQVEIKEEKGINFPDSIVALPALSTVDKELLPEIATFADLVNISFVQSEKDIHEVQEILTKAGKADLPLVAKIETKEGVRNLPSIITALIAHGIGGVMIARGDLAVEAGFNNLARTQQEILDVCASAHLPVIYATGVMETAMKNGLPARAEIIDVATSCRAHCLMLNKGPFVFDTIRLIQDVYSSLKK